MVLPAAALLSLSACNSFNQPISGAFDPLLPPGSSRNVQVTKADFNQGDLVRTIMDNTFFSKKLPKGNAEADKLLSRGTGMKVIRAHGSYLQVELDTTGEIGYVPTVMVDKSGASPAAAGAGTPGQYQVYPPAPDNTLPPFDPNGQPPGGAIPTVIDPTLPDAVPPAPGVTTPPPSTPPPLPTTPGTPSAVPTPVPAPVPAAAPGASEPPAPPVDPKDTAPKTPEKEKPAGANGADSGKAES